VGKMIDRLRVPKKQIKIIFVNGIHADTERVWRKETESVCFPWWPAVSCHRG
jgi:hypothetical protein